MKKLGPVLCSVLGSFAFACVGAPGDGEPKSDTDVDEAVATDVTAATSEKEAAPAGKEASGITFVAAHGCQGLDGTWLAQQYSPVHGGYYEFTVQMLEMPGNTLSGSIVARSWGGETEDIAPPDACDGRFHWTVIEPAGGRVAEDGSVKFEATSWQVGEQLCGEGVGNYSLDKLSVARPTGDATGEMGEVTHLVGTASDSALWADGMPIELTRTSCQ